MNTYTLLAISGSLRKDSYNTALITAFKTLAPEGVDIELVEINELPHFNQDSEGNFPEVASALKAKIEAADGIIISTPEYNRSIPGVLKNVIDWTSRPWGKNSWAGKPVYAMSASVGPLSGALAQYELKKIMLYLDAHVLGQPEFFLGNATEKFDEAGVLVDENTKEHIVSATTRFTSFIDTVRS